MRAAGAGIPAFFTPTGVGTIVEEGKEVREFDGRRYLLERALHADIALIRVKTDKPLASLPLSGSVRPQAPIRAPAVRGGR